MTAEIISTVSILHKRNPAVANCKEWLNYFDLVVGMMVRDFLIVISVTRIV